MKSRVGRLAARTAWLRLCVLSTVLWAASGCSATGGSLTLCPKEDKLLRSAEQVALCTNRYAGLPRELQKVPLEAYYVQPGDVLLLEVTDLDTDVRLPIDQTVMPDGTIDLAEYGRPVVAGLTIDEIEELVHASIENALPDAEAPQVNVRLTVAESAVFYVLGEVNAPGAYPLIGRETVLDALMTAGGLSDRASECGIILSRPTPQGSCRIVLPVCYPQIVQLGDATTNYQIQPGDRIFVSTRSMCEQLMFWQDGCKFCSGECAQPCGSPLTPARRPFALPITEPGERPGELRVPAAEPSAPPATILNLRETATLEEPEPAPPAPERLRR